MLLAGTGTQFNDGWMDDDACVVTPTALGIFLSRCPSILLLLLLFL
jgi:hypothetical protein